MWIEKFRKLFLDLYISNVFINFNILRAIINRGDNLKGKQAYKIISTRLVKTFYCVQKEFQTYHHWFLRNCYSKLQRNLLKKYRKRAIILHNIIVSKSSSRFCSNQISTFSSPSITISTLTKLKKFNSSNLKVFKRNELLQNLLQSLWKTTAKRPGPVKILLGL